MNLEELIGKRKNNIAIYKINVDIGVGYNSYEIGFNIYHNYDKYYDLENITFSNKNKFINWLVQHDFVKSEDVFLDLL